MNPDVFSSIFNAARLAEYGCRFAAAGEEIEAYCELLEGTSSILSRTKTSRNKLSTSLTTETKKHIDGEISRTETALERAWAVVSRNCNSGSKGKRIGWVFKDKDAAQTHKDVLAQRHATLVGLSLELVVASHLRPSHVQQPSSRALDLLATRHTKSGAAVAEGESGLVRMGSSVNLFAEGRNAVVPPSRPEPPAPNMVVNPPEKNGSQSLCPWLSKKYRHEQ